jgi:hypothetical protein
MQQGRKATMKQNPINVSEAKKDAKEYIGAFGTKVPI